MTIDLHHEPALELVPRTGPVMRYFYQLLVYRKGFTQLS